MGQLGSKSMKMDTTEDGIVFNVGSESRSNDSIYTTETCLHECLLQTALADNVPLGGPLLHNSLVSSSYSHKNMGAEFLGTEDTYYRESMKLPR